MHWRAYSGDVTVCKIFVEKGWHYILLTRRRCDESFKGDFLQLWMSFYLRELDCEDGWRQCYRMTMMLVMTLDDANVYNNININIYIYIWCSCGFLEGTYSELTCSNMIGQCLNKTTSFLTFIWLCDLASDSRPVERDSLAVGAAVDLQRERFNLKIKLTHSCRLLLLINSS